MKEIHKRVLIGISTIFLIFIMILFVDFSQVLEYLIKISYFGILLFIFIYTSIFLIRSIRLKQIYNNINVNTSNLTLFGSFGIGWAVNELTPGKIGDLVRIAFINEKDEISVSKSTCGVTLERFIDIFILFSFTCFALLYILINNIQGTSSLNLHFFLGLGAIILLGGVVCFLILFFKTDLILNIIGKISPKLRDYFEGFLKSFLEGINDFRKNKKKVLMVFLLSIPIWILETFTLIIFFYLSGFELDINVIILAQILTFFTKTFPLTPGGWVVSENAGALLIFLFYPSVSYTLILSIFILDHIIRTGYIFIYGISSIFILNVKYKNLNADLHAVRNIAPA